MKNNHVLMALTAVLLLMMSCAPSAEKRTDQAIQQVMNDYQAVGVAAVIVQDGQIVYEKAFGHANLDSQTPLTTHHFMRIASISKSFTATSLMQLVENGVISLDDDVSDLIGFQVRNPYHPEVPITLRMVFSHTASFRDPENYSTLDHINPAVNGDCRATYYDYAPGTGYNYSNLGLNFAGAILEKVSGVRFDRYVKDSVITPLGLHAGHNNDELDSTRRASIYRYRDGQYVESNAYGSVADRLDDYTMGYSAPIFSPTGGVKISAHDLATYMMMHMNYGELNGVRIISEESAQTMQTPVWIKLTDDYYEDQYGLCLQEFVDFLDDPHYNTPGNYPVGHTGDAYGLRSIMMWSPADGWGIVAITNGYVYNPKKDVIEALANAIHKAYFGISQSCDKTAQLTYEPFTGELRHAFGISTNTRTTTPIVLTRITLGDQTGYGEAALPPYLKETQESVCAFLKLAQPVINSCTEPLNVDSIMQVVNALKPGNHAAKASIDIALHDLYGKLHGQPLWKMWDIDPEATPCTSYTIGYDANDSIVLHKVREADWAKILKVKLGREEAEDKRMIRLIRSISDKPIYVDANQGWSTKEHALKMCQWLSEQGVVLIEQPMPKHMNEEHAWLCERVELPIIADEACQTYADVAGLQPYYDGINIKLMKCGGVAEARKMITLARELGMQVMIGCMTETSAGISAATTLSPLVDYADLDGHVLLANDPYDGIQLVDGKLTLVNKPGTGVTLR